MSGSGRRVFGPCGVKSAASRGRRLTLTGTQSRLADMPLRMLLLASFLCGGLLAADWSEIPELPHKVVVDWAQLPDGWNFGETASVAVDGNDHVWVYNRGEHPVIEFDKNGRFIRSLKELSHVSAHGIEVDAEGDVWLVDVAGHSVAEYSPAGRAKLVIAQAGRSAGDNDSKYGFNRPTGVAFRPDGGFYVSDGYINTRVVQYTKEGVYVRHWGTKGSGDGQFNLVHDVAIDNQGRLYVADRDNNRIQVFDADGKFLAAWTEIGTPWGVEFVAAENAIYVSDGVDNHILKLDLKGKILGRLGGFGKVQGLLDYPHHIAVDSEGSIYVAEIKNWRVQKFAKP